MERIWIIGSGHFGRIALERLSAKSAGRRFCVVDSNAGHLPSLEACRVDIIEKDGVCFLKRALTHEYAPDWIIPALPVHLAAQWCLGDHKGIRVQRCVPPDGVDAGLPNLIYGNTGDLYVSMADFRCPDNCPEPAGYCPVTRKTRLENLFDRIRGINVPGFGVLLLQSHQLAPGVGGFRPGDLFRIHRKLTQRSGKYLVGTACRCHGVITPVEACAIEAEGVYHDH